LREHLRKLQASILTIIEGIQKLESSTKQEHLKLCAELRKDLDHFLEVLELDTEEEYSEGLR
jgi:hypothetical protein